MPHMVAGYMVPDGLPVWILLPNSQGLFWWDAMIRWLAVAFFIQTPIDIAFNMQQRLPHWYYITIQVGSATSLSTCPPTPTFQLCTIWLSTITFHAVLTYNKLACSLAPSAVPFIAFLSRRVVLAASMTC